MASPLSKHPDHLMAIGRITVEMGALEAHLVHMLRDVLGVSEKLAGALLMSQSTTRGRIDTVKSVARETLSQEQFANASALLEKSFSILNKRNTYIHSVWGVSDDFKKVLRMDRGYKPPVEVPLNELLDAVRQLEKTSWAIIAFNKGLRVSRRQSPHYVVDIKHDRIA